MESALRVVSVERGPDPRVFTRVSFGGAGGLHVCDLAGALLVPRVIVPSSPGTLSALGVLLGDVVKDYSRTVMMNTKGLDRQKLERGFAELEQEAVHDLKSEGFERDRLRLARSAAMRYTGQSFEIDVPWGSRSISRFHTAHHERYGYSDRSRPTEIVSIRLRASGLTQKPRIKRQRVTRQRRPVPTRFERVYLNDGPARVPVFTRNELTPGSGIKGPAIITEYSSTTLIPRSFRVEVDRWSNLAIEPRA
jgi:N-methylhydantoinase A